MARLPTPGSDDGVWGQVLNEFLSVSLNGDGTLKDGSVTNATVDSAAAIAQSKISNLTTDLAAKVDKSTLTAKGDIYTATASGTVTRLGVGSDGQILTANSGSSTGLAWSSASSSNSHSVVTKSSAYTLTTADEVVLANASGGSFTLTLPTAVGNSNLYDIKKIDSSSNTVTIATTGGQTIDGGSTAVIQVQYASVTVVSNGSNWFVI